MLGGIGLRDFPNSAGMYLPKRTTQVTPIGYGIGNKIKWFIEVGYGYKGLINTGLSYKVRSSKKKKPNTSHHSE
jgi:hypothetical protein